jgi:hypothetical protein
MKKSISLAALAISASTASFAIIGPPTNIQIRNYCLKTLTNAVGGLTAGDCDETANNRQLNARLGPNGCADRQISLTTTKMSHERDFPIRINPCLPPGAVQL